MHGIEQAVFTDPWSLGQLRSSLVAGWQFLVGERAGAVVGYAVALHAADVAEILSLGVAAEARRRGVGRALVRAMLARLAALGVRTVYLEVRESNTAGRQLYATEGFEPAGRRRGYYRRPVEDALLLRYAISTAQGDA